MAESKHFSSDVSVACLCRPWHAPCLHLTSCCHPKALSAFPSQRILYRWQGARALSRLAGEAAPAAHKSGSACRMQMWAATQHAASWRCSLPANVPRAKPGFRAPQMLCGSTSGCSMQPSGTVWKTSSSCQVGNMARPAHPPTRCLFNTLSLASGMLHECDVQLYS